MLCGKGGYDEEVAVDAGQVLVLVVGVTFAQLGNTLGQGCLVIADFDAWQHTFGTLGLGIQFENISLEHSTAVDETQMCMRQTRSDIIVLYRIYREGRALYICMVIGVCA